MIEWGDKEISDLLDTLRDLVVVLNVHRDYIQHLALAIEELEARSVVTMSAYQGITARLDKLES